jgi:phosphatidylglycerol:prolipoprotein diacylglycerol transferase
MLYVGLVIGVIAGNVAAHRAGIDPFRTWVAMIVLIVPALAGARLLHVATYWSVYRRNLRRIWDREDGGAAMYGGYVLAIVVSMPLLAALGLSFGAFWDVAMFTILVGMIFTRVGCLLNGCCAGRPSSAWAAVRLPDHRGEWRRRIPTQPLEAALAAVLLGAATVVWRWAPFPGALFCLVTAGYAAGRLPLEFAREPEGGRATRFTIYHALSALLIVLSLAALVASWIGHGPAGLAGSPLR